MALLEVSSRTLLDLVADAARARPEAVAVRDGAHALSYGELLAEVDALAARLRSAGVGRGDRVGICSERSPWIVVAELAIWARGATCVPLDPAYPVERLRTMVDGARVEVALAGAGAPRAALGTTWLPLSGAESDLGEGSRSVRGAREEDVGFVFFTSGTTGRPKAVLVRHVGLWNRVSWGIRFHDLGPDDRVLWKAPFTFDASVAEIYSALGAGGQVVVAPPGSEKDPIELVSAVVANGVTVMHSIPPMLRALADEPTFGRCGSLRQIWSGGEILYEGDVRRIRSRVSARLTNQYGPTEASINATAGVCAPGSRAGGPVSIGSSIENMAGYVLDGELCEVPVGERGELHLGGIGLALGYEGDPRATAAAFIPDHMSGGSGERLYRTGDLVVRAGRDEFTVVGRVDDQVKIRGYRVEPAEVAAALAEHEGVADAAVVAQEQAPGDTMLVAYVVPRAERRSSFRGYPRVVCGSELAPASLNRHETTFLYDDIFVRNAYLRHGLGVSDGDVVVDVGANVGMFMLFAHTRARVGRYVAFEPNSVAARVFRANAELHGLSAELDEVAVGAAADEAEFTSYDHFSYLSGLHADQERERSLVDSFLEQASARDERIAEARSELRELAADRLAPRTEVVQVRPLSQLLAEHGVERVDLLKINAERSELAVLEGLTPEDWTRVRQVAVELEDVDGALARAAALLGSAGFELGIDADWSVGREQGVHYLYARRADDTVARWATPQRIGRMPLAADELREFLAARVPEFMLPAAIEVVDELPRTNAGKTNVPSLRARARKLAAVSEPPPPARRELDDVEQGVAAIWTAVLGRDDFAPDEDIFEFGAHSVAVAQIMARIRARFGIRLPLKVMFQTRTLARLAEAIRQAVPSAQPAAARVEPREPDSNVFPATAGQQALLVLQQVDPRRYDYNDYHVLDLAGSLDQARFARSLREAADRHAMLQASLVYDGERVTNVVSDDAPLAVRELDLTDSADRHHVDALVRAIVNEPFDLARPPLLRAALLRRDPERHVVVLVAHHTVCDEWSWRVYWRDVCALYAGELAGRSPAPARYAYRDFGRAEQHQLEEQLDEGLRFWTEMLRGAEAAEWLPPARAGRRSSVSGARLDFSVSKRGADAVRALAAECGATPFMALFAAYAWLLHQVTTATNPVIGMSVGLRDRVEFEQSVGYHANMNAIRCSCEGNPTFAEQVRRIRDAVLEADSYRWVPFHRVVKAVNPLRRGRGNPLFQSAIVLHDDKDLSRPLAGGAVATERRWHNGTSKFDLLLEVGLRPDSVQCAMEYALEVLDHRDASAFAAMFEEIVERAAENPELRLSEAAAVNAGDMAAAR